MVLQKELVIDCRGHLLGRLASVVAKEMLKGQKVTCVRTEEIITSGSIYRNKINFQFFVNKRMNTNPARGPFHKRSPSEMFKRTVRGMVPHKTKRGTAAFSKLKAYEGVPPEYQKRKLVVVPEALVLLRLKPDRKRTRLGDLAERFGWHHNDLILRLEAKRKIHGKAYHAEKKAEQKLRNQAIANVQDELADLKPILEQYGH